MGTRLLSLNGPDNVGKTTHLKRLADSQPGFHWLGAVHEHNAQVWTEASSGDYHEWWFRTTSTAELTRHLLDSDRARSAALPVGAVGLLDRGRPMIMAVAAATCAVKDELPVPAALRLVEAIESSYPQPADETAVLLLPSLDTDRSLQITSARQPRSWTGLYPAYQRALHRMLLLQRERGLYQHTVVTDGHGIDAVYAEVEAAVGRFVSRTATDSPL